MLLYSVATRACAARSANGLPYVIGSYTQSGQVTDAMFGADGIGSNLRAAPAAQPVERTASLPLDQAVIDFP